MTVGDATADTTFICIPPFVATSPTFGYVGFGVGVDVRLGLGLGLETFFSATAVAVGAAGDDDAGEKSGVLIGDPQPAVTRRTPVKAASTLNFINPHLINVS